MTSMYDESFPDIEDRFLPPHKWRWHYFTTPQGRKIRFGTATPLNNYADSAVIALQGRTEFTEKYFELANNLLEKNVTFWMIDWYGQGESDRPLSNTHKHHSSGFDKDVEDLHFFIMQYVKYASVHPDVGRIPLVMLGNSMGASIGLEYLIKYPDTFSAAAFCTPMIGIKGVPRLPASMLSSLTCMLKMLFGSRYIHIGGGNWAGEIRDNMENKLFTHDESRAKVQNAWCRYSKNLKLGNITYAWLHHALKLCHKLQNPNYLKQIEIPCLFACAAQDRIVDNAATEHAISLMPNKELLIIYDAYHEILMEKDEYRSVFLDAFFKFLRDNKIKENLKPF